MPQQIKIAAVRAVKRAPSLTHAASPITSLVILQLLTEVVIGTNYALGQVFMTAMALLMTRLAAPQISGPEIAPERVLDTIIGAIVGMVIAVLLSTIEDRRTLAEHDKSSRLTKAQK